MLTTARRCLAQVTTLLGIAATLLAPTVIAARAAGQRSVTTKAPRNPPPPADRLLATLGHDRDPLRRESAAIALGESADRGAGPALLRGLEKDGNPWVRAACASALGRLGDRQAAPALVRALAREKKPRVRRTIAKALVRLGERAGVDELLWQLKTENQYAKAEIMTFLVRLTGQTLGQDQPAWWRYFAVTGIPALRQRAAGSPSVVELAGLPDPKGERFGPWLYGQVPGGWLDTCAAVVALEPSLLAVTPARLTAYQRAGGSIPDGCMLLIRTGWRAALEAAAAAAQRTPKAPKPGEHQRDSGPSSTDRLGLAGPGLTEAAVRYLLARAPHLRGVVIDTPRLDLPGAPDQPGLALLQRRGRIAVEAVDALDALLPARLRLIIVRQQADALGGFHALLLAIVP